ncbi:MAG: hypothetical protein IPJ98_14075 [Bryobacterales bacterium]|nr:hypothetical protein [Bryobacterales bacterium]
MASSQGADKGREADSTAAAPKPNARGWQHPPRHSLAEKDTSDAPGAFGFRQQHFRLVRQHCEPHSCAEPSRAVKAAAGDTPSSAAISQTLIAFRMPVIRRMSTIGSPPHNLCGPRVD